MAAALRARGMDAALVALRGHYPATVPDPADRDILAELPPETCVVLDGIALGLLDTLPGRTIGLIHHPSPLHGLDGAPRAALAVMQARGFAAVSRLIATSTVVAARLTTDFGVSPARITLVAPGVEDAPRQASRQDGACRLLTLGPMIARRGHDALLGALARLFDLDWRLTIAGSMRRDPAHVQALRGLALEWGVADRVTLVDTASEADWQMADVFALVHPVPGATGAMMQALRRGIPLVLGATEAALPPRAGCVVVPLEDPPTLSKVLRRVVFDPALRARMAQDAWTAGAALPSWEAQAVLFAQACASQLGGAAPA